ncbi:MAG: hypothetical protein M1825_000183 [Sarcosagium campestre]|nr:MAG: hypothetical protein M1825_000183 [Sarcosagium campestre]
MATTPGSPPELSGSKSSKSSSFHSSLDRDNTLADVSHFEEIGLDDVHPYDHEAAAPPSPGFDKTKFSRHPMPRLALGEMRAKSKTMPVASQAVRDLTVSSNKAIHSTTKSHLSSLFADHPKLGLPPTKAKRNFTSPSTSSMMIDIHKNCAGARSPSPSLSVSGSISPCRSLHARDSTDAPALMPLSRRSSWQPSRKTVQQLEEEYDDNDEDVPDDAIFWNVPISPRPLQDRVSSNGHKSASTSPERKSPLSRVQSSGTDASDGTPPASAPASISTLPLRNGRPSLPSPAKPDFSRGASMGSFPIDRGRNHLRTFRSSSWNVALSELSEETKTLTEALEEYADRESRQHEEAIQNHTATAARPDANARRTKSAAVVELPPLLKSNVMIDPLPISKEKEAVLTRTRPSWLPPKSQKEEKKHLKEYQKIMTLSMEAERKKAERAREDAERRDDNKLSIHRIWDQHVLPNWDRVLIEPRTRELWWRGVPPRSRGVVWQRAIGNELELTETSYKAALRRAREASRDLDLKRYASNDKARQGHLSDCFTAIQQDANATFPELRIFQAGGPLHDALVDVLMAYAMYRSDVGYVHGTHTMAALLLLNLSAWESFVVLSNLLNRALPLAFLTHDAGAMARTYSLTLRALQYKLPALESHLSCTLHLDPADYLEPMFRTLFTRNLSVDVASRVWDAYAFEGDSFLVRCAVAVLTALGPRLVGAEAHAVLRLLGPNAACVQWDVGPDDDDFMAIVRSAGKEDKRQVAQQQQQQQQKQPQTVVVAV